MVTSLKIKRWPLAAILTGLPQCVMPPLSEYTHSRVLFHNPLACSVFTIFVTVASSRDAMLRWVSKQWLLAAILVSSVRVAERREVGVPSRRG